MRHSHVFNFCQIFFKLASHFLSLYFLRQSHHLSNEITGKTVKTVILSLLLNIIGFDVFYRETHMIIL